MWDRVVVWSVLVWGKIQANKAAVAALVSLIVAVTGLIHAIKEPGAVKTYDRLKLAVEAHDKAIQQNHDDIVRVRDWIDELRKADAALRNEAKSCSCVASAASTEPLIPVPPPPLASSAPSAIKPTGPRPAASAKPDDEQNSDDPRFQGKKPVKNLKAKVKPSLKKPKFVVLPDTLND